MDDPKHANHHGPWGIKVNVFKIHLFCCGKFIQGTDLERNCGSTMLKFMWDICDISSLEKKIWSNEKRPKTRPIWPPRGSLLEGKSRTISEPRLVKYYWIYLAGKLPLNHWCQEKAGLLPLGKFTKVPKRKPDRLPSIICAGVFCC